MYDQNYMYACDDNEKKNPENVNTEFYIINIFVSKSILEIKAKSQCPDIFIHDIGYTSLLFTCSKGY